MAQHREERTLTYERPAGQFATRRQFRLVLLLLLLNLGITIQNAYWPGLLAAVKDSWSKYQQVRQARALQRQALNFAEPQGKVVWDENPQTAATLLANPSYGKIRVERVDQYPFLANWPRGARAVVPVAVQRFYSNDFHFDFPQRSGQVVVEPDECALILLHGFKTPAGQDRLVFVYVKGRLTLQSLEFPDHRAKPPLHRPWSASVEKELVLVAGSCTPVEDGTVTMVDGDVTSLLIYPGEDRQNVQFTWTPPKDGKPEQIRLDTGGRFRFYAGRPDPADHSQFSIDYDLDERRGTIYGRIKPDGSVEMKPDAGTVVGDRWYPGASGPLPAGR